MKSYNHLWEEFISDENILKAIKKSSKGKRKRKDVKKVYENPGDYVDIIRSYAEDFHNCKHKVVEIYDGISKKKREIIVPRYREQIIHHMLINVLKPIFTHGMYEHTYGSIPKKGIHSAKKKIEKWIKNDPRNVKYCLKMDIKKFFPSIDQGILKEKLTKVIHDKRFLKVILEIIDVTNHGVPLGFFPSPWFANFYLQDLDHAIKEKWGAKHYIRFVDDMVIFDSNKKRLHKIRKLIAGYLENELGVRMKDNWQVFRFDHIKGGEHKGRFLDFLGFRFYRDRTIMRRSIMMKFTRKVNKIAKKEKISIYDVRQVIAYLGWLDYTDTHEMYRKRVKPKVNPEYLKIRMSYYDRNK